MKKEEKLLEKALKDYRIGYAKKHPEWAKKEAAAAKMMDEEVAARAAKEIWETAHLEPCKQAEEMSSAGFGFHWRILPDNWLVADVANRIFHEEDAVKEILCRDLQSTRDDHDIIATYIRKAKFIHFQFTKSFNGGYDAYVVLRIPKSARTIVVRLCK